MQQHHKFNTEFISAYKAIIIASVIQGLSIVSANAIREGNAFPSILFYKTSLSQLISILLLTIAFTYKVVS